MCPQIPRGAHPSHKRGEAYPDAPRSPSPARVNGCCMGRAAPKEPSPQQCHVCLSSNGTTAQRGWGRRPTGGAAAV
uniref:Uncharacterized protein n=1 Tax=Setaria viridis TaxID=4556 RepID=A0A4U6STC0_SETVI|nr:hypothetical protein SEVIR_9G103266v2 [Setaria viridis]